MRYNMKCRAVERGRWIDDIEIAGIYFEAKDFPVNTDGTPGEIFQGGVRAFKETIRRFQELGLDVHVTEFDVRIDSIC